MKERAGLRHIMFGGFDYPIKYEMNQEALFRGIDYFAEIDETLIGKSYLGKTIRSLDYLVADYYNSDDKPVILIGSIVYYTELEFLLKEKGLKKDVDFYWAIDFSGDEGCPSLWKQFEWRDSDNKSSLTEAEIGESTLARYKIASKMIDYGKNDVIIDLGAATGRMKQFLPKGVKYYPVDYISYSDETIVCDLNKERFPGINADKRKTCILMFSFLVYLNDWKQFIKVCTEKANTIIIAHNDFVRMNREFRRTHFTWNSCFFNHDIILEMQKYNFFLTEAYDFRLKNVIMKFEER